MRSVFLGLFLIGSVSLSAQTAKPKVPHAPDGHPDLQGTWDFAQLTPFERPGEFAGKSSITDEEAEEFAERRIETTNKDRRDGGAAADVERAYNDFWWDFGKRVSKQPSLVVVDVCPMTLVVVVLASGKPFILLIFSRIASMLFAIGPIACIMLFMLSAYLRYASHDCAGNFRSFVRHCSDFDIWPMFTVQFSHLYPAIVRVVPVFSTSTVNIPPMAACIRF